MLKRQYRELVESIIEQEKKLELARRMKSDAEAELVKCNDCVAYSEDCLSEYQQRLSLLEVEMGISEAEPASQ